MKAVLFLGAFRLPCFRCCALSGGDHIGVLEQITAGKKIGAAIRRPEDLEEALRHPNVGSIFLLSGDIIMLPAVMKRVRAAGKVLLVHVDLLEGVGKDRAGIGLLKRMGVSCLVTTKSGLVKAALDEGITVVQRLFIVDSEALKNGIRVAGSIRPDAVKNCLPLFRGTLWRR